jgi:hypothetical protein
MDNDVFFELGQVSTHTSILNMLNIYNNNDKIKVQNHKLAMEDTEGQSAGPQVLQMMLYVTVSTTIILPASQNPS